MKLEEIKDETKTMIEKEQNIKPKNLSKEELKLIKKIESGKYNFDSKIEIGDENIIPKFLCYTSQNYSVDSKLGLVLNSKENAQMVRKVLKYIFQKIGSALFKGTGIFNISLPLFCFEKMSFLERFAIRYSNCCRCFNQMALEKDPLEKMKYIITAFISSFHIGIQVIKPFNHILGETFQGTIGDAKIDVEQISHHPPISAVYFTNNYFTYSSIEDFSISTWPNSIVAKKGKFKPVLKLKDSRATLYTITYPTFTISNTLIGKIHAHYNDEMIFKDKTNKLIGVVRFQPDNPGLLDGFYGLIGNYQETRKDFFRGFITLNKDLIKNHKRSAYQSKDIISYFEGHWIEEIMFDGTNYWEIDQIKDEIVIPTQNPLPSDSRFRSDLQEFIQDHTEEAEKQKEILENIQRNDRKLREVFLKHTK